MGAAYHSLKKWNKVQDSRGSAGNRGCTLLYMIEIEGETTGA
jgi:hypothetical protein